MPLFFNGARRRLLLLACILLAALPILGLAQSAELVSHTTYTDLHSTAYYGISVAVEGKDANGDLALVYSYPFYADPANIMNGRVSIVGTINNTGQNVVGSYITITIPAADVPFIDTFSVAPYPQLIKQIIGPTTLADGSRQIQVMMNDITPTTNGSFPFSLSFTDRLTPEYYDISPLIQLHNAQGGVAAFTTDATFIAKVDDPTIFKYIVTNANLNYKSDGRTVYGGAVNATGTAIADATDVAFFYNITTIEDTAVKIDGVTIYQDWGAGLARTSKLSKIELTDTLPTYPTLINGVAGTAVAAFDPNKNPGWTQTGNTVTYTVNDSGNNPAGRGAEYNLPNDPVKLVLSFPDAATTLTNNVTTGYTDTGITGNITNNVSAKLYPYNLETLSAENQALATSTISDSITFKLDGQIAKAYGMPYKNSNDRHQMQLDYGSMHLRRATFGIGITNVNSYPMENVVLLDHSIDDRYYFYKLTDPIGHPPAPSRGSTA